MKPGRSTASNPPTKLLCMASHETPTRAPWPFAIVGAVAVLYVAIPVVALATRVPWSRLGAVVGQDSTHDLLRVTLASAVLATVLATFLGVGLAVWLHGLKRMGQAVRLLVYLPLAMPPVVGGLALSAALGRRGLLAPLLDALHLKFAFSFAGVVTAHTFVALPFVVVAVDSALRHIDQEVSTSARRVGMSRWAIWQKITLPTVAPSIFTGAVLACARSLGEFGTTITFAGSAPGITRTMSSGIYLEREVSADNAYALSAVLIGLAVLCLALAGLPTLLRKEPAPRAHAQGPLDIENLRELSRPPRSRELTPFRPHATTAVVGVNGAGKTTLLRRIADSSESVMLTQKPALPPLATVTEAITMVTGAEDVTAQLISAAGLDEIAHVKVRDLSGGQAAQAALVRALAARPAVLLLDEPLAAVDAAAAAQWRRLLAAAAHDRTTILVTHNVLDLLSLADDIAVVEKGEILAHAPRQDVVNAPPNRFVAQLLGRSVIRGNQVAGALQPDPQGDTTLVLSNSDVVLSPSGSITATVLDLRAISLDRAVVTLDLGGQSVDAEISVTEATNLAVGEQVHCSILTN